MLKSWLEQDFPAAPDPVWTFLTVVNEETFAIASFRLSFQQVYQVTSITKWTDAAGNLYKQCHP